MLADCAHREAGITASQSESPQQPTSSSFEHTSPSDLGRSPTAFESPNSKSAFIHSPAQHSINTPEVAGTQRQSRLSEPVRLTAISCVSFVLLLGSAFLFMALFAEAFHGEVIFRALSHSWMASQLLIGVALTFLLLLYLFDISYWTGRTGTMLRRGAMGLISVVLLCGAMVSAEQNPSYPMGERSERVY